MPGKSFKGPLPGLTPAQRELREGLMHHVERLSVNIGERNVIEYDAYLAAADYIETQLTSAGYTVQRQSYEVVGRECFNLEATIPGGRQPEEVVIVGAHYDSVRGCPGANDNGTAVAALLVLAEHLAGSDPARTLRFVAFANEEPPFFQTDAMGSMVYAKRCREQNENVVAMIALDGLGFFSDADGSQNYPFPLSLVYPSTANFIGFVGNTKSSQLVKQVIGTFRDHARFPSEGVVLPENIEGAGWSDHWSFWQHNYPGVMVTDTLPFRYVHYHTGADTIDKIQADGFTRVVDGLEWVVRDLANPQPSR